MDSFPEIIGPGAVLTAGRVWMKVTNVGLLGNPFPLLSSDPSGQWPGASGVEYLHHIGLVVAAADPTMTGSVTDHYRASDLTEWQPDSNDPADHIYETAAGALHGEPFVNDDGDVNPVTGEGKFDEDFLDGHDNDGDGLIDEDFAARGNQEFTLRMRDDTGAGTETPLGLECRQSSWCYSAPGLAGLDIVDYEIINRSGHALDSLYVGWEVDMNAGPASDPNAGIDDIDLPGYPHGSFRHDLGPSDPRVQTYHDPLTGVPQGQPLCPWTKLRVNGFSVKDADGDGGATPGAATFLLVDQTIDPLGLTAPSTVAFRAFRSYRLGTSFDQGGAPTTDYERYLFMSGNEGVDADGFVNVNPGQAPGDYGQYCSVGPYLQLPNGASIHVTIAFMVQPASAYGVGQYGSDLADLLAGHLPLDTLTSRYPSLAAALNLMGTQDGYYQLSNGQPVPDWHGRETKMRADPGQQFYVFEPCGEGRIQLVTDHQNYWFNFDCDYCTGVWDYGTQTGYFHHTWAPIPASLVEVPRPALPVAARPTIRPNPSQAGSSIAFALARSGPVEIAIVDVSGRLVRRVLRESMSAGAHEIRWDGRNDAGRSAPPGVYVCEIRSGAERQASRFVVLR